MLYYLLVWEIFSALTQLVAVLSQSPSEVGVVIIIKQLVNHEIYTDEQTDKELDR